MKKKRKPGFYIALILAQPIVFVLFCVLGGWIDTNWVLPAMRENIAANGGVGHPVPIFSILLPLIGAVVCIVVLIAAHFGLVRSRERQKREREGIAPPVSEWGYCPDCGAKLVSSTRCIRCGKKLK